MRFSRLLPWLLPCLPLTALAGPADAPGDARRVAILALEGRNVARDVVKQFLVALGDAVDRVPGFEAVTRDEIVGALGATGEKILAGCTTVDCLIGISRAHDARYLLAAELVRDVEGFDVRLQLVNIAEGLQVENRGEFRWQGDPEGLPVVLKPHLYRLLKGEGAPAAGAGSLFVETSPPGARLLVDGDVVGSTPLAAPLPLQEGQYTLRVELEEYAPREVPLAIIAGETTRISVALSPGPDAPPPLYARWWFWAGVGGAAATALAVGLAVGLAGGGGGAGTLEVEGRVP